MKFVGKGWMNRMGRIGEMLLRTLRISEVGSEVRVLGGSGSGSVCMCW